MTTPRTLSSVALSTRTPHATKCPLCGERIMKGITAWKFAWIDPKNVLIDFCYTCVLCADERAARPSEQGGLTEEQIRYVWDGVERLMKDRQI